MTQKLDFLANLTEFFIFDLIDVEIKCLIPFHKELDLNLNQKGRPDQTL